MQRMQFLEVTCVRAAFFWNVVDPPTKELINFFYLTWLVPTEKIRCELYK